MRLHQQLRVRVVAKIQLAGQRQQPECIDQLSIVRADRNADPREARASAMSRATIYGGTRTPSAAAAGGRSNLSMLVRYQAASPSESRISEDSVSCKAACMFAGGDSASDCSSWNAMSSQGMTICAEVAFTVAAKACTHCCALAWSGKWPILPINRLCSASEPFGVNRETSNPASARARGIRAVPNQRVAVETRRTGVFIRAS